MTDNFLDEHDAFLEDSLIDADTSFLSEPDNSPQSCNIDFSNGSPLNKANFHVAHYNINSITAENKLEQLKHATKILNISVLVCTESKLDKYIPTSLIMIP